MDLPLIIDIVVGLIFIYLILSLLASEIQELTATLLQWRAKHLKDSIENLLSGGEGTAEEARVKRLVNRIYSDPLLENINQVSRGGIENKLRQVTWFISAQYQNLTNKREGVFDTTSHRNGSEAEESVHDNTTKRRNHSGPSYIPSDTFATTLLETLKISTLLENLIELRLNKFTERILAGVKGIAEKSGRDYGDDNFEFLQSDFEEIVQDFKDHNTTLLTSIDRISEGLERYIKAYPEPGEDQSLTYFIDRVRSFKLGLLGEKNERAILSGGLKPNLTEMIDALNTASSIHQDIKTAMQAKGDNQTYQKVVEALEDLPKSVQDSLGVLARRAQTRVQHTENEINQLREEISVWFDRSMARASGVYKRNAKGFAILMGFLIAFVANADTFHIFDRLAQDQNLRRVVVERASQVAPTAPGSESLTSVDLEALKDQTNAALKDISLPVSWNPTNLEQQIHCGSRALGQTSGNNPDPEWTLLFNSCLPGKKASTTSVIPLAIAQMLLTHPWRTLQMVLGWFLSGLAIAMGAPFWFDLLGKVVNVRNSGSQPPSAATKANPK